MKGYNRENFKVVIEMAWPAVIESFFVAFAGLVDSLMVSRMGSYAVAAVGLTTQPKFMGLSMFFAINVSVSALVARRFGQKEREDANRVFLTALYFVLIAAVILSITFVSAADPIIKLCGSSDATPEDIATHAAAVTYFRIIMGGMIFNCIQMVVNSAQRGAGNTRITMRTNVTSNIVNIILNYLLIEGHFGFPALGIAGAALATVLGTVVSSVMSVISISGKDTFISIPYIFTEKISASFNALKSLIKVGYGIFFEQILMRIGFMATAVMAAKKGMDAMAAHQVGMNLMGKSKGTIHAAGTSITWNADEAMPAQFAMYAGAQYAIELSKEFYLNLGAGFDVLMGKMDKDTEDTFNAAMGLGFEAVGAYQINKQLAATFGGKFAWHFINTNKDLDDMIKDIGDTTRTSNIGFQFFAGVTYAF